MSHNGAFPADCTLLPLTDGRLLVARDHAVFCPIPAQEVRPIQEVLAHRRKVETLSKNLLDELQAHGFFGPPRPPKPDPSSVQIQLTNSCNLACEYCCTNSGKPRAKELGFDRLSELVDEVYQALGARTRIALLGGEPLLVPWALDLADHILSHDLHLTLFPNGLALADTERAKRAANLIKRGAEVRVSLGGATAERCDGISGAVRFETVLAALHQLARHSAIAIVDLMLFPEHAETIVEDFTALRRRLPKGTPVSIGLAYVAGRETGERLFRSRGELEVVLDRIAFEAGERIAAAKTGPLAHRREGCGCALGKHLHLRSDGALFACFKMEEKVGDLSSASFADVLQRMRANSHPARTQSTCEDCALATLCGGGCRSENLLYTGDADEPICGPWRVQVICELLAEGRATAVEWPAPQLLAEARSRGIDGPDVLIPTGVSRHLIDT